MSTLYIPADISPFLSMVTPPQRNTHREANLTMHLLESSKLQVTCQENRYRIHTGRCDLPLE